MKQNTSSLGDPGHFYLPEDLRISAKNLLNSRYPGTHEILTAETREFAPGPVAEAEKLIRMSAPLMKWVNAEAVGANVYLCCVQEHEHGIVGGADRLTWMDFKANSFKINDENYCIAIWLRGFSTVQLMARWFLHAPELDAFWSCEPWGQVEHSGATQFTTEAMQEQLKALVRSEVGPKTERLLALTTISAQNFMLLHEAGHILHGHLDYLEKSLMVAASIEETSRDAKHEEQAAIRRAFELDADCFAAVRTLTMLGKLKWFADSSDGQDENAHSETFALFLLAVAVMTALSMSEKDFQIAGGKSSSRTHPPFYVRSRSVGTTAGVNGFLPPNWQPDKLGEFALGFEAAYARMSGLSLERSPFFQGMLLNGFEKQEEQMLRTYANIHHELAQCKLCAWELPPPQYPT